VEAFAIETDVAGGFDAPRRVRGLVREQLADRIPPMLLGDVALLVTELVANGVRHGGADSGAELQVRFQGGPRALYVEVQNADRATGAVAPRPPDLEGGGGLGLHIVDNVASRWGVHHGAPTAVWFELDCLPDPLL
jgi:anti-sigma regulatory factor (Ser/Thr protein kinase)